MDEGSLEKKYLIPSRESSPELRQEASKQEIFNNWQELIVGEKKESNIDISELDDEQFKGLLYKKVEERLDETTKILGLNVDEKLIKKMNEAGGKKEKAEAQEEVIKSVVKQINSIPFGTWSFAPKEIERQRKLNCSGAALICGSMLNKIGIKTEYGNPADHSMNFSELADGSLLYVDSRNNIVKKIDAEEESYKELKIRRIDDKNIEYKIVPYFSQRDAIVSILENTEALKGEGKKEDSVHPIAKEIYEKDKELFDSVDYSKLSKKLYPDLNEFQAKEEWQEEEKRINRLHDVNGNLNKIKEGFEELAPNEQERIKKEAVKKKEFVREFLLSDTDVKSKLSKFLFDYFSDVKKILVSLKNWNREEYEKFVENFIDGIREEENADSDFDKVDSKTIRK